MIDSRIFPLLETLAASNLDWLVRDILATIEMGDLQLETENTVSGAQERVRQNEDVRSESEESADTVRSRPWTGDEQVSIAGELVVSRITETLHMARDSIEGVSGVIGKYDGKDIDASVGGLVLLGENGEVEGSIDEAAVEQALIGLKQLRLAVGEWISEMLGGTENR